MDNARVEAARSILLGDLPKDLRTLFGIKTRVRLEGWQSAESSITFRATLSGHPLKGDSYFADSIELVRRHAAALLAVRLQPGNSFTVSVRHVEDKERNGDLTPVG